MPTPALRACRAHWSRSAASPTATTSRPMCATDRKSTRLNSSHQIISYAVFCLKKKKKKLNQKTRLFQSSSHFVHRKTQRQTAGDRDLTDRPRVDNRRTNITTTCDGYNMYARNT